MRYGWTNNAVAVLPTGIGSSATTIVLPTGLGALFPSPVTGTSFLLTLENRAQNLREIVLVTARSTDTLTIVRAQEGTAALPWPAGTVLSHRVTAGALNLFDSDRLRSFIIGSGTTPVNGTIRDALAAGPGVITGVRGFCRGSASPAFHGKVQINGTNVAGLTGMNFGLATNTVLVLPSGVATFVPGDIISFVHTAAPDGTVTAWTTSVEFLAT